ncbi:Hypp742 [Branchiostoma lanceolatum]|uniref:Hypp742 protein n=1 Tax=Branchiostoma lanceolatum TaxID=7740 RepID=A0A8J9YPJ7_BRALA|nr:Hypp742 [Branchiostoma lanceolatum]
MAPPLEPAIVVENPDGVNPVDEDLGENPVEENPEGIVHKNKEKDPPGTSAQTPRSVPKLTCKFSGEGSVDWEEFEDQIVNERTYGAWGDALTLAVIRKHLTGGALQTLRGAPVTDVDKPEKLLGYLRGIYARPADPTHYEGELSMISRKPGETLQQFEILLLHVVSRVYPDMPLAYRDRSAKQIFMDRLGDPNLTLEVKKLRPKTLHDARVEAQFLEDIQVNSRARQVRQYGPSEDKRDSLVELVTTTQKQMVDMKRAHQDQITALCDQFTQAINGLARSTSQDSQARGGPVNYDKPTPQTHPCELCHQLGHWAGRCPLNAKNANKGKPK